MKNPILVLTLLCCWHLPYAQNLKAQLITSAFDITSTTNTRLTSSIGEPVIAKLSTNNTLLYQGFLSASQNQVTLSTKDPLNHQARLYPNPARHTLYILGIQEKIITAVIYDLNGKSVQRQRPSDNTIDVSELPAGVYSIMFTTHQNIIKKNFLKID